MEFAANSNKEQNTRKWNCQVLGPKNGIFSIGPAKRRPSVLFDHPLVSVLIPFSVVRKFRGYSYHALLSLLSPKLPPHMAPLHIPYVKHTISATRATKPHVKKASLNKPNPPPLLPLPSSNRVDVPREQARVCASTLQKPLRTHPLPSASLTRRTWALWRCPPPLPLFSCYLLSHSRSRWRPVGIRADQPLGKISV
jgi:hypothetical protein